MIKYLFLLFLLNSKYIYKYLLLVLFMNYFIFMDYNNIMINNYLFMDLLSYLMVMLLFWIMSLVMMSSFMNIIFKDYYNVLMKLIIITLYFVFIIINFFVFYIFFELSILLILFMIIGYGYQFERLSSGFYMFMYALISSLLLLLSIYYYYMMNFNMNMIYFIYNINSFYLMFGIMISFLVKLPFYLFHYWLPKAHVEASTTGSMILASLMLKLGGYGMFRSLNLFMNLMNYNIVFIIINLIFSIMVSLMCLHQIDFKILISYSSVVHMSIMLTGMFSMMKSGSLSLLIIMFSHGLNSSGLFYSINLMYSRLLTRNLIIVKGLINFFPKYSMILLLLITSNMSIPPSFNLLGELMVIVSSSMISFYVFILLMIYVFFNVIYSLMMFMYTQLGKINCLIKLDIYLIEYIIMLLHWIPLNLIIMSFLF